MRHQPVLQITAGSPLFRVPIARLTLGATAIALATAFDLYISDASAGTVLSAGVVAFVAAFGVMLKIVDA